MHAESILVVEDNLALSRAIQNGLSGNGYQTRVANTYAEGIAMIDREMPEVLVLDIELPDGSGWDILDKIRSEHTGNAPTVVIISSTHVRQAKIREYNASRYISKPFDINYLVETVDELLSPANLIESACRGAGKSV